jgi:hypothetical protein
MLRVKPPAKDTCWITTLAMLTDIDVDLFPIARGIPPKMESNITANGHTKRWAVDTLRPWFSLMETLGYELHISNNPPAKRQRYAIGFLETLGTWVYGAHIVAVSSRGRIYDCMRPSTLHGKSVDRLLMGDTLYGNFRAEFPDKPYVYLTERT